MAQNFPDGSTFGPAVTTPAKTDYGLTADSNTNAAKKIEHRKMRTHMHSLEATTSVSQAWTTQYGLRVNHNDCTITTSATEDEWPVGEVREVASPIARRFRFAVPLGHLLNDVEGGVSPFIGDDIANELTATPAARVLRVGASSWAWWATMLPAADVVTWRPTEPDPAGSVYATWEALAAAVATLRGRVTILLDPSLSPTFIVPAGAYPFACTQLEIVGLDDVPLMSIANGVTFTGGTIRGISIDNATVEWAGQTSSLLGSLTELLVIDLYRQGKLTSNGSTVVMFEVDEAAIVTLHDPFCQVSTFIGYELFRVGNAAGMYVFPKMFTTLSDDFVRSSGSGPDDGACVIIYDSNQGVTLGETQTNLTAGVTLTDGATFGALYSAILALDARVDALEDHVDPTTGRLTLATESDPSAPSAGNVEIYAKSMAGREMPAFRGSGAIPFALQPFMGRMGIWKTTPGTAAAANNNDNCIQPTAETSSFGAQLAEAASVGFRTQLRHYYIDGGTSTTSYAGYRGQNLAMWRGNGVGLGGFYFTTTFGYGITMTTQALFAGLIGSTAAFAANDVPSAKTDCIFFGYDSADATCQIMHNDSSGTCTKISLTGWSQLTQNDVVRVSFWCAPNSSTISYMVENLSTGLVASGTTGTSNLPTSTQFLTWHVHANVAGVSGRAYLDWYGAYGESGQ
jgi:hypothetical protein